MDCEDIIRKSLGRGMSESEIDEMLKQARDLKRRISASKSAADLAKEARENAAKWAAHDLLKAKVKKRNTQLQLARRAEAVRYILDNFAGMEGEGLSALQVGSKYLRQGARLSVDQLQTSLRDRYLGSVYTGIRQLGGAHWRLYAKGLVDEDVARALWSINNPRAPQYQGSAEGMAIAKVIYEWKEIARKEANNAGAWISELPSHIISQTHDQLRIRRAGLNEWRDHIRDRLDWSETAEGKYNPAMDRQAADLFLENVYNNLATGVHFRAASHVPNPLGESGNTGSAAARLSHERVLHFRDADAWLEYNRRFGSSTVAQGIARGFENLARSTGIMRVMGPAPEANFRNILEDVRNALAKRGDTRGVDRLNAMTTRLKNQQAEIDGSLGGDGNPLHAEIGRNVRALMSMSKLGGCVISGFSDVPTIAQAFAYRGRGFMKPLLEVVREATHGRGSVEQQRILSCLGVFFDSVNGNVVSRFAGNDGPGKMAAAQNLFFKMNGLSLWTDAFKRAASLMESHALAQDSATPWSGLKPALRRALSLYDIDEGTWNMLRKGPLDAADGRKYLTPEIARHMDMKEIEAYHQARGLRFSAGVGEEFRLRTEEKLRAYFHDQLQSGVLEPDARTRAIIYQGTKGGTIAGEALRCIMQFKSFSAVFMQRVLGREIYGRGADTMLGGLGQMFRASAAGDRSRIADVFLTTTLFGYASMTVKQLIAGRTPRDPSDPGTWLAAMSQGGGLGIYGDYLFGEASRMGDSFLSSLAGPSMGAASSLVRLYQDMRDGNDVRSNAFRTFFNLMPGNNLYWARAALDHLICYNIYEHLNPGYLRRMERRVRKENNQTFYWRPRQIW